MYAQKLEGDEWLGETLDKAKIDKMSGIPHPSGESYFALELAD